MSEPKTKVLVIGVDAAEPTLLEKWAGEGDLPNIAALIKRGVKGSVQNPVGFEAGAVWPTFHTGKMPGKQQQYEAMRYFDPRTYEFEYYKQSDIETDLMWEYFSKQGKRCAVIDAPYCQIDPSLNGIMIFDWAAHVPAKGGPVMEFATHPPEIAQEVLDLVGPDPTEGIQSDNRILESVADHIAFRDLYLERLDKKGKLISHFLNKGGWDYFEAVFTDCHSIGHKLWHVSKPDHPEYSEALHKAMGDPIRDAYMLLDKKIGEVLACIDDRTLALLFISHGMGPHYSGTKILDRILENLEQGVQSHGEKNLKEKIRTVWHLVPPEARAKLRPIKKHFNGMLQSKDGEFSGNRQNRRFFEVFVNNRTAGVRVNLKGREANGQVDPAELDGLLGQLTEDLLAITNLDSNERLVEEVIRPSDHYSGEFMDRLPDLLVTWNRSGPINNIQSDKIGTIRRAFPDARRGDHTPFGYFLAAGDGIDAQVLNDRVDTIDFFPTICSALDIAADEYEGKQVDAILRFKNEQKMEPA